MTTQPPLSAPSNYADVFDLTLSPYGATFRFGVRGPVDPKTSQQSIELNARVFMSLEHLKAMAFVMTREVLRHERTMDVQIKLASAVVKTLEVSQDEWDQFWYGWKERKSFGPSVIKSLPEAINPNGVTDDPAQFPFPAKV